MGARKAGGAATQQAPAAAPAAQAGGNPFKQTLTVFDMVVYGLIMMVPIAPMGIYGGVFQASGGMRSEERRVGKECRL